MRSSYKILNKEGIYFVTSTIVEWMPVFTSEKYFRIMTDTMTFCKQEKGLSIYAYVIMDNHFHMVAANEKLSDILASLKMFTAKRILEELKKDGKDWLLNQLKYYKLKHKRKSEHQVWQESFHPLEILSDRMMEQKIDYIHFNPVKRGFVEEPEHWVYSSAGFYKTGKQGIVKIDEFDS